jgi:hypothetical protein
MIALVSFAQVYNRVCLTGTAWVMPTYCFSKRKSGEDIGGHFEITTELDRVGVW